MLLFLVVIYFALIYWTYADARRRIDDPMLVACATAASLFPFIGTIVYLIVRPPEFLDDVRERELEMAAAEARLAALDTAPVPALRVRGREGLPALPELPAAPEGAVQRLRQAARPALEDLPLLRGRGRPAHRRRDAAAANAPERGRLAAFRQPARQSRAASGPTARGDLRERQRQASLASPPPARRASASE